MIITILGLGKMGRRIAKKLLASGYHIIVWNRSEQAIADFIKELSLQEKKQISIISTINEITKPLTSPRLIWSMLPAGDVTQGVLEKVFSLVTKGDIVVDGGNTHYQESQKWFETFAQKKVRFLGIGISGGILASKNGFALMAGGDKSAYEIILPILQTLAKPFGNVAYVGAGGAGHFVKMVHNGIEYGMMQSLGEGFGVLEKSPYQLNLAQIAKIYCKGTIISGFLTDRVADVLTKDSDLSRIDGVIDASGEAAWTIEAAKKEHVPVPIIKKSLTFREASQKDPKVIASFAAKLIAAIRHEFGGHKIVSKESK
jgi:6-phosphogluconate dehydrogenase